MEHLQAELDSLLTQLPNEQEVRSRLSTLVSVYPFNEFEYIISTLLAMDVLTLDAYRTLRNDYIDRNPNAYLFEKGPTAFGSTWAEAHLRELAPLLEKATGHDLRLDDIRVEVKAPRAVDKGSTTPLVQKALSSVSSKPFVMNFQQTKPKHFDVIVWIGVWRDTIRYWVLTAKEIERHRRFSDRQHRGNVGEGQLHVKHDNIDEFMTYEVEPNKLEAAIRDAYERQGRADVDSNNT